MFEGVAEWILQVTQHTSPAYVSTFLRGSKYPISGLGSQIPFRVWFWSQKPKILDNWTFWGFSLQLTHQFLSSLFHMMAASKQ